MIFVASGKMLEGMLLYSCGFSKVYKQNPCDRNNVCFVISFKVLGFFFPFHILLSHDYQTNKNTFPNSCVK